MNNVHFEIARNEDLVTGFTLKGIADIQAEKFCVSFLQAYSLRRAEIKFDFGSIHFRHFGISDPHADRSVGHLGICEGGEHYAFVPVNEVIELVNLCNGYEKYNGWTMRMKYDFSCGKGFRAYSLPPSRLIQ